MVKIDVNRFGIGNADDVVFNVSGEITESEKKENDAIIEKLNKSLGV